MMEINNTLTKSKLVRDKKIIKNIILMVLSLGMFIAIFFPDYSGLTFYLMTYVILGYCIFDISFQWLSSLTLFFVFYSMSFAMGEIYAYIEGVYLFYNPYLVVLGALICVILGYVIGKNIGQFKMRKKNKIRFPFRVRWIDLLFLTYIVSTIACLIYFMKNRALLMNNLEDSRIVAAGGNGILLYPMQLHIMTIPLMYEEMKKKRLSVTVFWILTVFAIIQLMVTGFRTPFVNLTVVLLIIVILNGRLTLKKVFPIVSIFILAIAGYGIIRSGSSINGLYYLLRGRIFVGMQNLNQVFRCFPDKIPFQYGSTYFINLTMLRPGPDVDFTLWLKDALGISFSGGGLTPTVVGEFYLNFGYVGIVIGMFILGIIFARIDKWVSNGEVGFWKAFILLESASCSGGGIANVYLLPLIFGLYYWLISLFRASEIPKVKELE